MAVTPQSWSWSFLSALGAPTSTQNLKIVMGWIKAESSEWPPNYQYNPLNTTESGFGGTGSFIKSYPTWSDGLRANLTVVRQSNMSSIASMLKSGNASSASAAATIDGSPWGTTDLSASLIDGQTTVPGPGGTVVPPGTGGTGGLGGTGTTPNSGGQFYVNTTSGIDTDYWTALTNWGQQANWYVFTDGEILYIADGYIIGQQVPVAIIGPLTGTEKPDPRVLSFTAEYDNTAWQYYSTHKRRSRTQRKTEMAKVTSPTELTIDLICDIDAVRAGDLVQLIYSGPFDGPWLVGDCTRSVFQIYSQLTLVPTLQPIIPGTLSTPSGSNGTSGTGQSTASAQGYTNPFSRVKGLVPERIDMGVDYAGTGELLAIGSGTIKSIYIPGWPPANCFICWTLEDGAYKGKTVYFAESIHPSVRVGQHVNTGDVIGTMYVANGIECGWAASPGLTLAAQRGQFNGSNTTAAGASFSRWLKSLGAPPGITNNPPTGTMPPGYP